MTAVLSLSWRVAPILALALLPAFPARAVADGKTPSNAVPPQKAYLKAYVNRENVATGERLIYEVRLYSPDKDVVGVTRMKQPRFEKLPHAQTAPDSQMDPITDIYGREWYSTVIDRFFLEVREDGKHAVKGGSYEIATRVPNGPNDNFWGLLPVAEVETEILKAPNVRVKSSKVPSKGRPADFSGAVGNFSVRVSAPQGYVKTGSEFPVIVAVSGEGNLDHAALPDIRKALPEGLQLVSVGDQRSHYVKDGALGSEMEIECRVCAPESGDFIIAPIEYSYYNSLIRKYVVTVSDEVAIHAVSTVPGEGTDGATVDI